MLRMLRMNKAITINNNSAKRYLSHSKINDNKATSTLALNIVGGLIAALIVSFPIVAYGTDYYDQWRINETLMQGQHVKIKPNDYERKDISESLASKISPEPQHMQFGYYVITGVKGVGKSTAVKQFTKSRYNNEDVDKRGGVIYVSCDGDFNDFGKAFADAISYSSIYKPSLLRHYASMLLMLPGADGNNSKDTFDACKKKFYHAVENYKNKTGKIPVLIIDNMDNYLTDVRGKLFLQILRKIAKTDTDNDVLRFVFVTDEDEGLDCLGRRQEPRENFLVISDMSDKDAFHYIEYACKDALKQYDINEVKQMIHDITGGRISALEFLALIITEGKSLEELKKLQTSAEISIANAGMTTPSNKLYEPFWKVAKLLLTCEGENKTVGYTKVIRLINNCETDSLLMKSNVFSYNQVTNKIGFRSRAIQYCLQQQANKPNENKQ